MVLRPAEKISAGAHYSGQKCAQQYIVSFQAEVAAQGHYFMVCNLLKFLAPKSVQEHLIMWGGDKCPRPLPRLLRLWDIVSAS